MLPQVKIFELIFSRLEAETVILREHTIEYADQHRFAVEVLVKRIPDNQEVKIPCFYVAKMLIFY